MSECIAKYDSKNVSILIENGLVNKNFDFLNKEKRHLVITDTNLLKQYKQLLNKIPNLITIIAIKPGEGAKSLKVYEKIIKALKKIGLNKDDVIISFGGGVINNLTGFIACTYLRGIEYIQIPTSLTAQIDSSIGGKCGINLTDKNDIGCFYHPTKIIVDQNLLKTLPQKEFFNGMTQIIKYGLIKDNTIISDIQKFNYPFNANLLFSLIERSIKVKIYLTHKDEYDESLQHLLNLGQTFGKIILKKSKNKISYGEAVAIGMYYELNGSPYQNEVFDLLQKYQLANNIPKWNIDFIKELKQNNKDGASTIELVELIKIGSAKIYTKKI